jgi:hypothetical protein
MPEDQSYKKSLELKEDVDQTISCQCFLRNHRKKLIKKEKVLRDKMNET